MAIRKQRKKQYKKYIRKVHMVTGHGVDRNINIRRQLSVLEDELPKDSPVWTTRACDN